MNNYKNNDKIHIKKKAPVPDDFAWLTKDLLSDEHKEEEIVSLGVNRGQYFFRIPSKIAGMLSLNKENKIKIIAIQTKKGEDIKLEIIRDEKDDTKT